MEILFLMAMGAVAGLFAGLLGIGGGIIIVPVLAIVFESQGVSTDVMMHVAIGTSLATIVVTSISSIRAHNKRGAIDWAIVRVMAVGVFIGGLLGAVIAKQIDGDDLKLIFAVFMLIIAVQMYFGNVSKPNRKLPATAGLLSVSTLIGIVASLMGVGGGSMSVPFLTWCQVNIRNAIATSAAVGFPIAVSGTLGFIVTGWGMEHRPVMSLGFVNLPAFFSIVVASTLSAPLGAWIAHRVPPVVLKRVFSGFLLILSIRMFTS